MLFSNAALNALNHANLALLDANGEIVFTNSAWRRFALDNGSSDDFLSVNYLAVCDSATGNYAVGAAEVSQAIRRILAGKSDQFSIDYPCHSEQEHRWFCLRISSFEQAGRLFLLLVHDDITKTKLDELETKRVQSILIHDLKSPIGSIRSLAEAILKEEARLSPFIQGAADLIRRSSDEALAMIRDLLLYDRIEEGGYPLDLAPIDLDSLMEKLGATHEAQWKDWQKGFSYTLNPGVQTNTLLADQRLIYSLFDNLIKNAFEAAPAQSKVTLGATVQDGWLTANIHNQGAVPTTLRARFFDKYATDGKVNGTGLGTYFAKLIAEAHYGEIRFTSSEIEGTHLLVRLPVVSRPPIRKTLPTTVFDTSSDGERRITSM